MKFLPVFFLSAFLLPTVLLAQSTQTVRGQVMDQDSKYPVYGANVVVLKSDPILGGATDDQGYFVIENVPLGRIDLRISAVGYNKITISNLLVISGKELNLDFEIEESLSELDAVVLKASEEKVAVNNELATVSARSFNVEETERYAGSRNDPARMAANFAGVSGANDSRNDIIIRGNSPAGVLWRLEGIDIPSPNHFSSFGSTGGPVSMLNNNLLSKSDFITAAFPANYGNALAGVFDLQMRNGNPEKREFLGQIGFNGFEIGAEGPFSSKGKASYLVNYRYSTLGAFEAVGINFGTGTAIPKYQDLSFKVNIPTEKYGKFVFFGLGGDSDINLLGSDLDLESEDETDLFGNENDDIYVESRTGIVGVSHTYFFNPNTFYKLTLAASHQRQNVQIDSLSNVDRSIVTRYVSLNLRQNKYSAHLMFNQKFDARNNLTAGAILDLYDIIFADSNLVQRNDQLFWFSEKKGNGTSLLNQFYVNWQHKLNEDITINTGLRSQQFDLSTSMVIEPRLGIKYQLKESQSLSFGYGLHHQLQPLPVYYTQTEQPDGSFQTLNQDLDFTSSHHLAVAYDKSISRDLRVKGEIYYQAIGNAPVERFPSAFSMLNSGDDFGTPDEGDLINEGKGRNYGLELTLEKFYSQQYYFLLTTSLFNSRYQGSDEIWRNTSFNGNYVINLLGGKEFSVGRKKNTIGFDLKLTVAGGRAFTPIDLESSIARGEEVLFNDMAFSERLDDYFRADLKLTYRMNRPKTTHEFSLDIQNITDRQNIFSRNYNRRTQGITTEFQLGLFPIPQYRILF